MSEIGRFTTDDGDAFADPDGEFVLYQDYEKLAYQLSSCESARRDAIRLMRRYRKALRQAWMENGCTENEVDELLEALDK